MTKPTNKGNPSSLEIAIGYAYFVTVRIADSLPMHIVKQLKDDYQYRVSIIEKELPEAKDVLIELEKKRYFGKFDQQLDQRIDSSSIFHNRKAIDCFKNVLEEKRGVWYELHAYSILPNHVHFLIDTSIQYQADNQIIKGIPEILSYIKKKAAYDIQTELSINRIIWQKENYFHKISNEREWMNVASYILTNPVKAGLVRSWKNWEHSYLKP